MPSGTSFFDAVIYKKTVQRWWLLGLGYAAALTCRLMTRVGGGYSIYGYPYSYPYALDRAEAVLQEGLSSILPAVFAVAMVMAAVGWLHRSREAAFVTALPVRRRAAFLSSLAGGLTPLLAAPLAAAGLTAVLLGTANGLGGGLLSWLGIMELMTVAYFGFAAFCAVLTGHWLALPALYAILLFAAAALEASVRRIAQFLIFGLGSQRWILTILSPAYYLRTNTYRLIETWTEWEDARIVSSATVFRGWGVVLAYAAAGLLFVGIAAALLRRRRMECAGDVAAEPWLRPVFRAGAAVAAALSLGLLTLQSVFGYSGYSSAGSSFSRSMILLFMMLLGAFLGWFVAEMLLRKTLRVFDRHWGGLGVIAALIAALVLGCELDVLGVERAVPDPARVDHVEVACYNTGMLLTTFSEPESIAAVEELHRHVAENKRIFERESRASTTGGTLEITYYDKNGVILTRSWAAPGGVLAWASRGNAWEVGSWATWGNGAYASGGNAWGSQNPVLRELEAVMNLPEARAARNLPPAWLEISPLTAGYGHIYLRENGPDGYGSVSVIRELDAEELCDLVENAILPDLRDTTMGCAKLMPEGQVTYPTGDISFGFLFARYDEDAGEQWWYSDAIITPDARRTIAWLEAHGIHLDGNAMMTYIDEEM